MKATEGTFVTRARVDGSARRLGIYFLLITGSILFCWPLLWMAATSAKLSRETFGDRLKMWPRSPQPRIRSPYIDRRFFADVSGLRMSELLPVIERQLRSMDYAWPSVVDRETAIRVVARGVFKKLTFVLPIELWDAPLSKLAPAAEALITPALVTDTLAQVLRTLRLGPLIAGSEDQIEAVLVPPDRIAQAWHIGGTARAALIPVAGEPAAILRYDFSHGDTVKLTGTFTTPFRIDRLQRLQLAIGGDATFHSIALCIEQLGVKYKAERTFDLADFTTALITWQKPGPDDRTAKKRTWMLLKEVASGPQFESDPHRTRITIELHRNGLLGAWWAKIRYNYRLVLDLVPFWRYFSTSLFLVTLNLCGTLFSCSLVAYGFARIRWPGRHLCFALMLVTVMIPPQVTMIPQFLIMKKLGWYNTLYPLWVTSFFASAFSVFLLRQFMKGIPRDLEDAARIDGCGLWRVYWHIILPQTKPALAVVAIFTFLTSWNDFLGPLIYLNDQRLYPLSLGLYALNVDEGGPNTVGMMMAASLLMALPVIIVFFLAQQTFLRNPALPGARA